MAVDYLQVVLWLGLYLGLGVLALPFVAWLTPQLPDRGAGLALPAALATVALGGYWLGQYYFGIVAAVAGVALLAAGTAVALVRGARPNWRPYIGVALVFSAAFLFMLQLRALDPGAWPGGGEKFLDFGLLASLLRAEFLPPEDPWFAGAAVQYYYGGHMLAAMLAELTGTQAQYAYNYALAGYYAAFVAAAYGVAGTIAKGAGRSYEVAGVLAAFFVGIASNLAPPLRLLAWVLPWSGGERLLEATGLESKGLAGGPSEFNYWFASRVIDGGMASDGPWQLINEFPFFAWLNGDMHGHMMSPVFLLLLVGLGYAYFRTPADAPVRRRLVPLLACGPVVGLVALTNTWSAPTAVGLVALTVAFAPAPPWANLPARVRRAIPRQLDRPGIGHELSRFGATGLLVIVIAGLGGLAIWPFLVGPASSRGIGFLPTPRADMPGLLVVFGPFLAIGVAYLLRTAPALARTARRPSVLVSLVALFVVTWLYRATAVFLFVPPLLGAWWALRRTHEGGLSRPVGLGGGDRGEAPDRGPGFPAVLLIGICGILVLIEFAYVVEQAGPGRYNTAFKVYAQAWALWAIVAGVTFPAIADGAAAIEALGEDLRSLRTRLVRRIRGSTEVATDGLGTSGVLERSRIIDRTHVPAILAVVLLVSMSVYAGFGVAWQFENGRDEYSLDARAYVAEYHPDEYEAIEWLADREGQPNLVEAPGVAIYQWVNGPSSLTGIPSVAGWAHEIGYRGRDVYMARVTDVRELYKANRYKRANLLRHYRVEYIYVGPIEKKRFGSTGLDFAEEPGISVAHQSGDVTIYAVDRSELSQG